MLKDSIIWVDRFFMLKKSEQPAVSFFWPVICFSELHKLPSTRCVARLAGSGSRWIFRVLSRGMQISAPSGHCLLLFLLFSLPVPSQWLLAFHSIPLILSVVLRATLFVLEGLRKIEEDKSISCFRWSIMNRCLICSTDRWYPIHYLFYLLGDRSLS